MAGTARKATPAAISISPLTIRNGPSAASGLHVAATLCMLKLLGSYAIAKLLGFGLFGAIVIYLLLTLVTR
jgi:hypothetical protein